MTEPNRNVLFLCNSRISLFLNLPIASLEPMRLKQKLREIGARGTEKAS